MNLGSRLSSFDHPDRSRDKSIDRSPALVTRASHRVLSRDALMTIIIPSHERSASMEYTRYYPYRYMGEDKGRGRVGGSGSTIIGWLLGKPTITSGQVRTKQKKLQPSKYSSVKTDTRTTTSTWAGSWLFCTVISNKFQIEICHNSPYYYLSAGPTGLYR